MKAFIFSFLLFVSAQVVSQQSLESKVDQYIMQQMQQTYTPGIAIGIVRDGKVLLAKGYGLSNVELAVFTGPNSVFQLLSIGKQFTAAAIMLLVQSGKLSLDQSIIQLLPDVPRSWKPITVRFLLNHTSGVVDLTDIHPFFENIREDATPQELLKPVYPLDLLFQPGTQWGYSNSNYFLLGLIIEKLSGKTYKSFIEENMFQPLGMYATRLNDLTDVIPYRVNGYHWLGENAEQEPLILSGYHGHKNVLQNAIYISPTREWAAGAIVSSINDLIKWDSALDNNLLLQKSSFEQMVKPGKLLSGTDVNYGFGNELFTIRGHRVAGHQGGGMGFNTTYLKFLDDHLTVIILCNQTRGPGKPMAMHIASFIIPSLDYSGSEKNTNLKESKSITELFRKVVTDSKSGYVDFKLFADEAQETAKFISRAGPEFLKTQGELKSIKLMDEEREGGKEVYTYRTIFEKSIIIWKFELNKENRILNLTPAPE